jgi:hypothetical protein
MGTRTINGVGNIFGQNGRLGFEQYVLSRSDREAAFHWYRCLRAGIRGMEYLRASFDEI